MTDKTVAIVSTEHYVVRGRTKWVCACGETFVTWAEGVVHTEAAATSGSSQDRQP